jgi:two-component system OmpR family sensor kinase
MSLRRRLQLGCLAVMAVLFVADLALAATFNGFLLGRADDQLVAAAARLRTAPPVIGERGDPGRPRPPRRQPEPGDPFTEFYVGYADPSGVVLRSGGGGIRRGDAAPPSPPPGDVVGHAVGVGQPVAPFTTTAADGVRWRIASVDLGSQLGVVGVPLDEVSATLNRMNAVLAGATVAVLVTLAGVALWVLRQGVRPLDAMTATAGAIAAGDLTRRVEHTDERTEAGRLGTALNTMIARIERAFAERAAGEQRLRRFVADASHELRTPLTSIRGYAELYRTGALDDPARLADAMRRVEDEAARMGVLVEDLLLLARLDQGRQPERAPVRLDVVAEDAAADARAVDPSREVTVTASPVTVRGDDARLRQVVANLVGNALRHTPSGTPVRISVASSGGVARVEVADSGPGMDVETASRVFERFFRADPARTGGGSGGSGLGLSIVAAVVAAHGGRVSVDTAPGAGARFVVEIPREES